MEKCDNQMPQLGQESEVEKSELVAHKADKFMSPVMSRHAKVWSC